MASTPWGPSFATTPQRSTQTGVGNRSLSFGPQPSQSHYIGTAQGGPSGSFRYQAQGPEARPFRFGMGTDIQSRQPPSEYVRNASGQAIRRDSYGQGNAAGNQNQNPIMDALNTLTGGSNNTADIQTSITPQGIYSPQQTQEAKNQAVASQQQMANLPWLQGRYARPGMSQASPGIASQALPAYGAALAGAQQARVDIPFQDTRADAANILAGQTAREGEAIDWYRILSGLGAANRGAAVNNSSSLLNMLAGVTG